MSKLKKVLLMCTAYALVAALAIGGTVAYLTSEDSDVNVMTMGNVKIEQIEQQYDENGNLVDFEQDKPLYPYVGTLGWKNTENANGAYRQFTMNNVVDKYVSVKNTGKSDAYVRTLIAFEMGDFTATDFDKIGLSINLENGSEFQFQGAWNVANDFVEYIDGYKYNVMEFVHSAPVKPGETTVPSLLQVYLSKDATNEDVAKIDGNGNGKYDILVLSQAVQAAGFENANSAFQRTNASYAAAKNALDTSFGVPEATNTESGEVYCVEWFTDVVENYEASLIDTWDGTSDTSWYDPANPLTEYEIGTAEQLAGLAQLVSADTTFDGVTFILTKDIDLYCEDTTANADGDPLTFRPIGDHSKNGTFEGVFDGNGNTIYNLYQNGWDLGYEWGAYGSYGLFGNLNDATVKNLTLSGGESYIEGGDVSFVAGSATGTCVFENITIKDSIAATYNNGCGGIIGWSGAGNYTFKNITIAEDAVLAGLWGSFDSSIGGIVGQGEPGATYNFENVDIACRIDAYNDCTASYDYYNYRMCGMIIGRLEETTTIDGKNYPDTSKYNITCTDVTVTYGKWADYHYCRAESARGKRVEAGYSYGGIPVDYDHSVCTVHHMECIPFDQIFGGDQYAVKGLPSYDGVTVNYNNK